MRSTRGITFTLLAGLLATTALTGCELVDDRDQPAAAAPESIEATFARVVDGDTIDVEPVPGLLEETSPSTGLHPVRLLGIDTPEMNYRDQDKGPECGAQEATDHLEELLSPGQTITLSFDPEADRVDRYGRTLAYISTEDIDDVALQQANDGYAAAWYPRSEPEPQRHGDYAAAAETAAAKGRGARATCQQMGRS